VGWQVFTVEFDRWLGGFCHLVMLREAVWKEVGCCQKHDFNGFRQTAKIMAKMAARSSSAAARFFATIWLP
jgi:hypothetical protein